MPSVHTDSHETHSRSLSSHFAKLFKRKPKVIGIKYYPNNIGLYSPSADSNYEFLIVGKAEKGAQGKILMVFLEHKAEILSLNSNLRPDIKEFTLTLVCNLDHSNVNPKDLLTHIREMKFVTAIDYREMGGRIFGRLFPLTFYDKHRAVGVRSTTLIKLGQRLAESTGSTGLSELYLGGRAYALEVIKDIEEILEKSLHSEDLGTSVRQEVMEAYCVKCRRMREIRNPSQVTMKNKKQAMQGVCPVCSTKVFKIGSKTFGKVRNSILVENLLGFFTAAGWGKFELRTETEGRFGTVTILDPPTLDGNISYGNQFVEGIAGALLESVGHGAIKMELVGQNYDPNKRVLNLHFAEQVVSKSETSPKSIEARQRAYEHEIERALDEKWKPIVPTSSVDIEVKNILKSLAQIEAETTETI